MSSRPDLAAAPRDHVIPSWVKALAGTDDVHAVWENEASGVTYRLGDRLYLKWQPAGGRGFEGERARLEWAGQHITVPEVVDAGAHESGPWLLTRAVPGESAVSERWKQEPRTAVVAIGQGLRTLHDSLPVEDCPFDWGVESRLERVGTTLQDAERQCGAPPPVDRLVVCHGDACSPNTLLGDDGRWSAHVDLDCLGVADRWADIAVATYSLEWNYGEGFEDLLLEAYGIEPDPERTRYYRALWDIT